MKNEKTLIKKKDKLIDIIIDDLKNNEYESRNYIYSLVRESLRTRKLIDLKQIAYPLDYE